MNGYGSMKPLIWITGVLALTLGLAGSSCATQKSAVLIKDRELSHKQQAETSTAMEPDAATKAEVQAAYGKLPLSFEVNQGQSDPQVKFLSRGNGYTLFLTPTEAVLALREPARRDTETQGHGDAEIASTQHQPQLETRDSQLETVVRMKLIGANSHPQVMGLDELRGKVNYFIGNDPKNWHTNIPTHAKVQYRDIYPGIDLIYYGNQRQLEYDLVVAPGADPKVITLAFDGLVGAIHELPLPIDGNGDLILHTAGGEIRLHKPRIYQEINGVKQPIPSG